MKRFLFTITMALSLHVGIAQDSLKISPHHHAGESRHHGKMNWASLNLTEDQQNKMAALQKEHRAKMLSILTPEQRKKLEKQKADKKAHNAEKSATRMENMKSQLNLSATQSEKLTKLNQDFREKAAVIRANQTLAAAEQHKKLKALTEAHQTDIKAMLDPAQQSILEEIKARRHRPASK